MIIEREFHQYLKEIVQKAANFGVITLFFSGFAIYYFNVLDKDLFLPK